MLVWIICEKWENINTNGSSVLGVYQTREKALDVLDELYAYQCRHYTKVYGEGNFVAARMTNCIMLDYPKGKDVTQMYIVEREVN